MKSTRSRYFVIPIFLAALLFCSTIVESADTAAEIDRDVDSAIQKLYASSPAARELSKVAKGILVFPNVIKGGLIIGGQYGKGALRVAGKTVGYYSTAAASYGLQAGAQSFGYAMFFITESALKYLEKSAGWEIGTGPSIRPLLFPRCLFGPARIEFMAARKKPFFFRLIYRIRHIVLQLILSQFFSSLLNHWNRVRHE